MSLCHSWPWSDSVLQVLNAISQFEQQANNKFFHKQEILEVESPVSLNMIYRDEALKNLLCTIGKIKLNSAQESLEDEECSRNQAMSKKYKNVVKVHTVVIRDM